MNNNKKNRQLFLKPLHVGRPNIGDRRKLYQRIDRILDNSWLTNNGTFVQELERELAKYLGVKHCIAMCNGTIALELAVKACALRGEVIVPSLTFVATAHALKWQEIDPVFCDIDSETYCIDPHKIEALITERTTGILGVHLYGTPCNIDLLVAIAKKNNLKLIFDAAHAFGCSYRKKMIGNFGDCEVFSFHATKVLNSFEGGAIATNNDNLAKKIRLMKNFGFSGEDLVVYIGTNGKMNEVCAAMGLTNLENISYFIENNRRNWQLYKKGLESIPGIDLVSYNECEKNNYQYVIADIDSKRFGIHRDRLKEILYSHNILARRYFYPGCHRMEPYSSINPNSGISLPVTEAFCKRVIALPTGTQIEPEQIDIICTLIREVQQANYERHS